MNYYNEVKNELIKYEIYNKVKEYNCEVNRITTFFKVGKILRQVEIVYGKSVIENIANKLSFDVYKKYNYNTLYSMRRFYDMFSNKNWRFAVNIIIVVL